LDTPPGVPEMPLRGTDNGATAARENDLRRGARALSSSRAILVVVEIRIEVSGDIPPAKGEAKSMLSGGHSQVARVQRLLMKASDAMAVRELLVGDISLEVSLTAPSGTRLPDATNMLGGIGDVLQARTTGANVEHLGRLARVACFYDDAQIREIHYRRTERDNIGYVIVIRSLDT